MALRAFLQRNAGASHLLDFRKEKGSHFTADKAHCPSRLQQEIPQGTALDALG